MKLPPITKSETLKAKIGLGGPLLSRIPGPAPQIPDHEMLRCIGQGSYGEVWLARNAVGTMRAVKIVYRQNFKDPRPYEREFAGIQSYEPISRSNDGLIDVLQIGRNDAAGYFYYIMELADCAEPDPETEIDEEAGKNKPPADQPSQSSSAQIDPEDYVPKTLSRVIQQRGRLSYEECLTLGLTLNLALGYLHRNGLIHRDVKPSNIVFVNGVPKLTDIGLVTGLAGAQSFVGTEGFIPPEGPNSPQADLYALGKVLYEASMGKDRNQFPEPMTALAVNSESKALMELNAVLVKACATDPKARYHRAEEMNADLALLHNGESVRNKHTLERRLKRMKQAAIATVAIIVLAVVPYYLALREAQRAKIEAHKSHEVAQFLKDTLQSVAPSVALGRDTTILRDILNRTARHLNADLKDQPSVEAELRFTLGLVYQELADYNNAEAMLTRALELYQKLLSPDDLMVAQCLSDLSLTLSEQGKGEEAEKLQRRALAIRTKRSGPNSLPVAASYQNLGIIMTGEATLSEAERMYRKALEIRRARLPADDMKVAASMEGVASVLTSQGHWKEAETMFRDMLKMNSRTLSPANPSYVSALNGLVSALLNQDKLKEAEESARQGIELDCQLFGTEHPLVAESLTRLARVLDRQNRFPEAKTNLQAALVIWSKRLSNQDPTMGETVSALFDILLAEADFAGAENVYQQVMVPSLLSKNPNKSVLEVGGTYLARRGRWQEAKEVYLRLIRLEARNHRNYQALAAIYVQLNELPAYHELCHTIVMAFGSITNDPRIADRMGKSCMILPPEGPVLETAARLAQVAVTFDNGSASNPWFQFCKGLAEFRVGHYQSAIDWMQKVALRFNDGTSRDVQADMVVAMAYHQLGQPEKAISSYEEGMRVAARRLQTVESGDIQSGWTDWVLANALIREAKQVLARPPEPSLSPTASANPR